MSKFYVVVDYQDPSYTVTGEFGEIKDKAIEVIFTDIETLVGHNAFEHLENRLELMTELVKAENNIKGLNIIQDVLTDYEYGLFEEYTTDTEDVTVETFVDRVLEGLTFKSTDRYFEEFERVSRIIEDMVGAKYGNI